MQARTIVTSQPDVACDVCERRLLRGEQSDVFIDAGARRVVCELCAPRALHEGWLRESEHDSVTLPPPRTRRGRGLFARLRAAREPDERSDPEAVPYDFLADPRAAPVPARTTPADDPATAAHGEAESAAEPAFARRDAPEDPEAPAGEAAEPSEIEHAIAVFNASEYPRRVAGVARSLGAPEVCVHRAEHASSVVVIVVAWELCWYRYQVDLDELELEARVTAQGTELEELAREDRLANAVAGDAGTLALGV